MIKLIASDMDGTLLNASMQISEENIQAIKYAQSKGIEFMVATGRNRKEALPPLQEAGIDCAMITLNGAQVYDEAGNSLFTVPISHEQTRSLIALPTPDSILVSVKYFAASFTSNSPFPIAKLTPASCSILTSFKLSPIVITSSSEIIRSLATCATAIPFCAFRWLISILFCPENSFVDRPTQRKRHLF